MIQRLTDTSDIKQSGPLQQKRQACMRKPTTSGTPHVSSSYMLCCPSNQIPLSPDFFPIHHKGMLLYVDSRLWTYSGATAREVFRQDRMNMF